MTFDRWDGGGWTNGLGVSNRWRQKLHVICPIGEVSVSSSRSAENYSVNIAFLLFMFFLQSTVKSSKNPKTKLLLNCSFKISVRPYALWSIAQFLFCLLQFCYLLLLYKGKSFWIPFNNFLLLLDVRERNKVLFFLFAVIWSFRYVSIQIWYFVFI